jgi:hypothetical protein
MEYISITEAKYIEDYKIYLKFNDEKERLLDFETFISTAVHPDIKKYQNKELFKNFTLKYGDLEWNDYELTFPIYDLYQGKI